MALGSVLAGRGGPLPVALLAAMVVLVGCGKDRAEVAECGDVMVNGNVIVPYGVTVLDCAAAERVAQSSVGGRRVRVSSSTCKLEGVGQSAVWRCEETLGVDRFAGEPVADGESPRRDDQGRIHALVFLESGHMVPCYQCILIAKGVAEVAEYCSGVVAKDEDFCEVLTALQDRHDKP